MPKNANMESARQALAQITAEQEDASFVAAEGQATPDIDTARRICGQLIVKIDICLSRANRLRKRLV